ncbi:hypothetical protein Pmar_PMAR003733 [Perkinsus marinus ATCC 50983]|uniref:Uncharacterized protein n=1 Tax=Perkinsus marinus (strain ATCC 50983 / TXsc) TaxID=423536 RepID=C5KI57_PERM5|nr:hypothetical protein Pmar_PMAR003733 [Perkinsus marinus ATCC 50983]EER16269.1 hypothetical protein Pmar_PMAR003733 [Perkinsus marinus ATCC 50983]|eukprot:XP_002784473.1 hypothetical protein Pmar_PMAR003733 [Perkinsus marinus ATCC 50983]
MVANERLYTEIFTKKYLELCILGKGVTTAGSEVFLIELQGRCLGRAKQFVEAVKDEHYGGWHLIAAQDWPTDEQVRQGLEEDVMLVYAGE